ncbi:hypothetical protein DV702_15745 [Sporosarcina sp. PTS2304]|uniref:YusW family protein n=1 Tax=Sporosarcina sp. PTS2304 TaxID=2283194 RepID=UPI000E0CCB07|nr:YusW family protein [Sporosarcina sp. PTS2304]AXI01043.1 hypothetical protein DV702_15745 [Sporosarcina sp. PTS2304]
MSFYKMLSIIGVSSLLVIGGCSQKEDPPDNNEATGIQDEQDGSTINTGDGYGFTDFDLTIKKDGKKIEVDYEDVKPDDAEYVNEFQEVDKKGNEAIDSMHPMFLEVLLDSDTTQEQAIDKILQWYGLDDYDEFDLDVIFTDDQTLTIDEKK